MKKNVVATLILLASFSNLSMAGSLNGLWVSPLSPKVESLRIHHGIAHFKADCGPQGSGNFKAKIAKKGNEIVFHAPYFKNGHADFTHYEKFNIYMRQNGNTLKEIKPFPSSSLFAVGFWHGASCSFGISNANTGAIYQKSSH